MGVLLFTYVLLKVVLWLLISLMGRDIRVKYTKQLTIIYYNQRHNNRIPITYGKVYIDIELDSDNKGK